jgi:hypothetical protein
MEGAQHLQPTIRSPPKQDPVKPKRKILKEECVASVKRKKLLKTFQNEK